ncbi:MAG: class I SAM-dependent methyltransferase, partial [Planctomycetota bacterium]
MPTEDELGAYYTKSYRLDYQLATTGPKQKHIAKRNREAAGRVAHVTDLLPRNARTLDFGCGSGEFVSQMLEQGFDAHGFEPGEDYGRYAQGNLGERIKIGGWQNVTFDKPFDLVTCFHVVEHVRDPISAISKMVEWLAPEGLAYIEVPDLGRRQASRGFGELH